MNQYIELLSRLRKQKEKIKDLSELIFRVSFNKDRIRLLSSIVEALEKSDGILEFEWLNNSNQRKKSKRKGLKIIGQFKYKLDSPERVLTVHKKL